MAYNVTDLISRVQSRIKDTSFSSTLITQFLDDAQNDIFNEYRLPFMQATQNYTLASGVADITNGSGLPTDFVQAIDLYITTAGLEKVLPFKNISEVDTYFTDPSDTTAHPSSIPEFAYKYGENIYVYPAPASAYTATLRYYKRPAELDGGSDVPDVPQEFREALVMGATYRVFQVKDNYDKAAIIENKYIELLSKLASRYSQTQVGHATTIRINRHGVGN